MKIFLLGLEKMKIILWRVILISAKNLSLYACPTISYTSTSGMLPCDLFNRLSHHYIRFVERESRARGNTRNCGRKPGLRYFRKSRVNFRSEHCGSQGLSHYGRNNPQKRLESLTSLSLSLSLLLSHLITSRSVTRDPTEILIHPRLRVKRRVLFT